MTEIQVYNGQQGNSLEVKMRYAQALANAGLLPSAYRGQPANLLIAIELGQALGIPTIQAINDIHVIDGKPSASANLIAAMIRKAGHRLRISTTVDPPSARVELIRADDPDFTYVAEWDMEKARTAGLLDVTSQGKKRDNWYHYPDQMCRSRAITQVARDGATDVLYGVTYTPEELEHETTQIADAELAELETEAARKKMGWLVKQLGMDRETALTVATANAGREITDSHELSYEELQKINAALEASLATTAEDESHIEDAVVVDDQGVVHPVTPRGDGVTDDTAAVQAAVTPADLPEDMISQGTQRRQRAQRRELGLDGDGGGPQDQEFWALLADWHGRPFASSIEQTEAEAQETCRRMQIMIDAAKDGAP